MCIIEFYGQEVSDMDYNALVQLGCELGVQLMRCGAEIYRVEDSIRRLMTAYGAPQPQVFAIPSCLIVSVSLADSQPITQVCRIPGHGIDLDRLEQCNALCRRLCRDTPSVETARTQVQQLDAVCPRFSDPLVLFGHFLTGAAFTLFFRGTLADCLCGGLCGLLIALSTRFLRPIAGANAFFRTLLSAALSYLLAFSLVRAGVGAHTDIISTGALMLLVPGVSLTTAMREVMAGDLVSGLSDLADSVLTAIAIALGTGAVMALTAML